MKKEHSKVITEQILDLMTAIINNANGVPEKPTSHLESWIRVKNEWVITQVMVDRYIEENEK